MCTASVLALLADFMHLDAFVGSVAGQPSLQSTKLIVAEEAIVQDNYSLYNQLFGGC